MITNQFIEYFTGRVQCMKPLWYDLAASHIISKRSVITLDIKPIITRRLNSWTPGLKNVILGVFVSDFILPKKTDQSHFPMPFDSLCISKNGARYQTYFITIFNYRKLSPASGEISRRQTWKNAHLHSEYLSLHVVHFFPFSFFIFNTDHNYRHSTCTGFRLGRHLCCC